MSFEKEENRRIGLAARKRPRGRLRRKEKKANNRQVTAKRHTGRALSAWATMQPIRFGETTPLGLYNQGPQPRAVRSAARNESFAARLGCLMAAVDQRVVADCFWSTARLRTAWQPRWPLRDHKLCPAMGDIASRGVRPMVSISCTASCRNALADVWRAAVGLSDRDAVSASWRTDIATLLDWIDGDPRSMGMSLGSVNGIVLLDGPTTIIAEIVWSRNQTHNASFLYLDLVDLCRALEHGLKEADRYGKRIMAFALCASLLSVLLVSLLLFCRI